MDRVPRVGINLSGESIVGDPHLLSMIEQELEHSSVDPSKLIFEVTETAAIANMPEATRFARGLTSLGCSLALDDFGTGFGSFYYLKHLPVSYVKLDGEFIQNLPRSEVDEHMVEAIVGVSQALGIKTVAESVADEETIGMLQKHHVDYAQGFYVGKPAPSTWPCPSPAGSASPSRAARSSSAWPPHRLAEALDQHRLAHAAGDAHRLDPERAVERAQAVQQRGHDARAGHPERVAEGDRATERVELLVGDPELVPARNDLRRERLVDLHHIDVVDLHAGLLEQGLDRGDRAEAHDLGADRRHAEARIRALG